MNEYKLQIAELFLRLFTGILFFSIIVKISLILSEAPRSLKISKKLLNVCVFDKSVDNKCGRIELSKNV